MKKPLHKNSPGGSETELQRAIFSAIFFTDMGNKRKCIGIRTFSPYMLEFRKQYKALRVATLPSRSFDKADRQHNNSYRTLP